jgi:hypothetical protein
MNSNWRIAETGFAQGPSGLYILRLQLMIYNS